jgi:hypothetical protein
VEIVYVVYIVLRLATPRALSGNVIPAKFAKSPNSQKLPISGDLAIKGKKPSIILMLRHTGSQYSYQIIYFLSYRLTIQFAEKIREIDA